MRTQLLLILTLLFLAGCKTVKQTERHQEVQRQTDTQIERMEVLRDSIHLKTNVTTNQIVLKYSEPDTAGMQYIEEVTITGQEANTWLDKKQNKTVETKEKENSKENASIQEKSKEKRDGTLLGSFDIVLALLVIALALVVALRVLKIWKK